MRRPQDFTGKQKLAIQNVLNREWGPYLDPHEFRVAAYIMDNSIQWGRKQFDVTMRQMQSGIPNAEGPWPWKLPPINVPERTLNRTLKAMKQRGIIISVVKEMRCTFLSINLDWRPADGVRSMSEALSGSARMAEELCQGGGPYKQNGKQNEENNNSLSLRSAKSGLPLSVRKRVRPAEAAIPEQEEPTPVPAAPSRTVPSVSAPKRPTSRAMQFEDDTAGTATERVQRQSVETTRQKAAAAREQDKAGAYHTTYVTAWRETYPGVPCPTWSEKDQQIFRSVLKARIYDNVTARHDFVSFVVRNWAQIRSLKLGWMTKLAPPDKPMLSFLTNPKMMPYFLDAFAERTHMARVELLPAEEQEIARLMMGGMTRDEALIASGKRRALSEAKTEETETRRINGEALRKAAEARKQANIEARRLMRERAEAKTNPAPSRDEGFAELGDFYLPPVNLPPIDHSKWN